MLHVAGDGWEHMLYINIGFGSTDFRHVRRQSITSILPKLEHCWVISISYCWVMSIRYSMKWMIKGWHQQTIVSNSWTLFCSTKNPHAMTDCYFVWSFHGKISIWCSDVKIFSQAAILLRKKIRSMQSNFSILIQ